MFSPKSPFIHSLKKGLLLLLGLGFLLSASCGKVTQISKTDDGPKPFDLELSLEITPTSNATASLSSEAPGGKITVLDSPLYVTLSGISEDGKLSELAWGRATLAEEKPVTTESKTTADPTPPPARFAKETEEEATQAPKKTYRSISYRKDGIKISAAKQEWAYLNYQTKQDSWSISTSKNPKKYPLYRVAIFSHNGKKVALKLVEASQIPKDNKLKLGAITAHDSFLATLFMMDLSSSKAGLKDTFTLSELNRLFSNDFFDELAYSAPTNQVKKFKVRHPVFLFDGALEKKLLEIGRLTATDDLQEVTILVEKLRKKKHLNKNAASLLLGNVSTYNQRDAAPDSEETPSKNAGR